MPQMKCKSPCKRDLKWSSATELIWQFEHAIYLDLVIDIYRCEYLHPNIVCKICEKRIPIRHSYLITFSEHFYMDHTKNAFISGHGIFGIMIKNSNVAIQFPYIDSSKLFLTGDFKPLIDFMSEELKYEDTRALKSSYSIRKWPHLEHKFNEIYAACLMTCIACGLNYESPPAKEVVYAHLRLRCAARV